MPLIINTLSFHAYALCNIDLIRKAGVGIITVYLSPDFFLYFSCDQEYLWHIELFIFILLRDLSSSDRRNWSLLFFTVKKVFLWYTLCDEDSTSCCVDNSPAELRRDATPNSIWNRRQWRPNSIMWVFIVIICVIY